MHKNINILFRCADGFGFFDRHAYIVQVLFVSDLDGRTANLLFCGVYYVRQAAGIGAVGFLSPGAPDAGGRALPLWATMNKVLWAAVAMFSTSVPVIIASGALMNLTIGVLSGCYLTRLATDVPRSAAGLFWRCLCLWQRRYMAFIFSHGGKFLWSSDSFYAVLILAALSLTLLWPLSLPPHQERGAGQLSPGLSNRVIGLAAAVLFLLSLEHMLGFSFPLKSAPGSVYIEFTRAFYAIGLIIAGLISDKNRLWGAVCCLAALACPFAALAIGNSAVGETAVWMVAYLFLGFMSAYRILLFSDLAAKNGLPGLAVAGLLVGRLGEAAGTLVAGWLTGVPLIVVSGVVFALAIALFFSLYQKIYSPNAEEIEKRRLAEYASRFGFSAREQDIFNLLVQGCPNAEIARKLYITESTVKFHVGNILKKAGLTSRLKLITDYKLYHNII